MCEIFDFVPMIKFAQKLLHDVSAVATEEVEGLAWDPCFSQDLSVSQQCFSLKTNQHRPELSARNQSANKLRVFRFSVTGNSAMYRLGPMLKKVQFRIRLK